MESSISVFVLAEAIEGVAVVAQVDCAGVVATTEVATFVVAVVAFEIVDDLFLSGLLAGCCGVTGGSAFVKIAVFAAVIIEEAGLLAGGIGAMLVSSSGI